MTKLYWITGASSGIGAEVARLLATQGHRVAISARRQEALEDVAKANPDRLLPYPLDVTDRDGAGAVVTAIENEHGPIDAALFNAGAYTPTPVTDFKASVVETMMQVNVVGPANCIEHLMPRMMERRHGHLALMASVAGYRGLPRAAGYSASKAAVIAMAQSLKAELDGYNVKVQAICPGFVKTALTEQNDFEMPYLMEVEDAARRIVDGMNSNVFEVAFPKRFAMQLKTLQKLPDSLFFPIIKKTTGQ